MSINTNYILHIQKCITAMYYGMKLYIACGVFIWLSEYKRSFGQPDGDQIYILRAFVFCNETGNKFNNYSDKVVCSNHAVNSSHLFKNFTKHACFSYAAVFCLTFTSNDAAFVTWLGAKNT